jgi:hypothetical protein
LSINIQKLVCDDARYNRFEMAYKTTIDTVALALVNAIFSAYYIRPED